MDFFCEIGVCYLAYTENKNGEGRFNFPLCISVSDVPVHRCEEQMQMLLQQFSISARGVINALAETEYLNLHRMFGSPAAIQMINRNRYAAAQSDWRHDSRKGTSMHFFTYAVNDERNVLIRLNIPAIPKTMEGEKYCRLHAALEQALLSLAQFCM